MEAIIFALVSYFTWGTGIFFEAIAARRLNSYSLAFWAFLLSFIVMSFYAPFVVKDLSGLTFQTLVLTVTLAFIGIFLGTIFYYEALKLGNRALVGTIASSFPATTVVLSIFLLGEQVSSNQIISIAVIFIGLFLVAFNVTQIFKRSILFNKGVLLATVTMLSWGIYFTFIKIPVKEIGWFWPNYITFFLFPLIFLYIKARGIRFEGLTYNKVFVPLVVSTVLVRVAELSYNLGISKGLVTIVSPIAGANPTIFVILAFLFFKDPITKQQIAGIITTLIGIVLLSAVSV